MMPQLQLFVLMVIIYAEVQGYQKPKRWEYFSNGEQQCIYPICWKDSSYPLPEIKQQFHFSRKYDSTFGNIQYDSLGYKVDKRDSCGLCRVKYSLKIKPLSIMDDNVIRYILHTTHYQHNITLTLCHQEQSESKCKQSPNKLLDYEYGCEQKYTKIKLLTYNFSEKKFEEYPFNYPSACSCQYKRIS